MKIKYEQITGVMILLILIYSITVLMKTDEIKIDYNCSDFKTQEEAQEVFNLNEEDIYKLDKDKDGIPREALK